MTFRNTVSFISKSIYIIIGVILYIDTCFAIQTCTIEGKDLTTLSSSLGFQSTYSKISGGGSCTIRNNSVIVGANQVENTVCHFTFFKDLKFTNGITVTRVEFTKPFVFIEKYDEAILEFTINVTAVAGKSVSNTLSTVTLAGDKCEDWRQSF